MGLKDGWQKRIEKNAITSDVSWTDKKGRVHNEKVVMKRSRLPLIGDWARIYPPLDENGKILWFNFLFGGKKNFFRLLLMMVMLFLIFTWITNILGVNKEYMDGSKYVIVEKTLFDKYCQSNIYSEGDLITTPNNLSVVRINRNLT